MLIEKIKKIECGKNGMYYNETTYPDSLEFLADIPENAVVDCIKVNGKSLEAHAEKATVFYPRDVKFDGLRIVGVYRISAIDRMNDTLWRETVGFSNVNEFEVAYHEVATVREN